MGIRENLKNEIINYEFKSSFFDIFVSISASCRALELRGAGRVWGLPLPTSVNPSWCSLDPSVPRELAPVPALPAPGRGTRAVTGVSGCLLLQLLALFRFVVLLLGYAVVRLRHWWVIAVRRRSGLSWGEFSLSSRASQGSELCPLVFQVTTLVSSAFLIVKVILSEVGFPWARRKLLCDFSVLFYSLFGSIPVVSASFPHSF